MQSQSLNPCVHAIQHFYSNFILQGSFNTNHSHGGDKEDYYLEMEDVSDEEGVPEEARSSPAYRELIW